MKLLENLSFESLGEALSTEECIDGRIDAKLESYRLIAILLGTCHIKNCKIT